MDLIYLLYFLLHLKHCQNSKQTSFQNTFPGYLESWEDRTPNSRLQMIKQTGDNDGKTPQVEIFTMVDDYPRVELKNDTQNRRRSLENHWKSSGFTPHNTIENVLTRRLLPKLFVENQLSNKLVSKQEDHSSEKFNMLHLFRPEKSEVFQKPLTNLSRETAGFPYYSDYKQFDSNYPEILGLQKKLLVNKRETYLNHPKVKEELSNWKWSPYNSQFGINQLATQKLNYNPFRKESATNSLLLTTYQPSNEEEIELNNVRTPSTLAYNNSYQQQNKFTSNVELINNGKLHSVLGVTNIERHFSGIKDDLEVSPLRKTDKAMENDPRETVLSSDKLEASLKIENRVLADFERNTIKNETAIIATSSRILSETKTLLPNNAIDHPLKQTHALSSPETDVFKSTSQKPVPQSEHIGSFDPYKPELEKEGYYQKYTDGPFDQYSIASHHRTHTVPVLNEHHLISYTTRYPSQVNRFVTPSPQVKPHQLYHHELETFEFGRPQVPHQSQSEFVYAKPSPTPTIIRVFAEPLNFHQHQNWNHEPFYPQQQYQQLPKPFVNPLKASASFDYIPTKFADIPPTVHPFRGPPSSVTTTPSDDFGSSKVSKFPTSLPSVGSTRNKTFGDELNQASPHPTKSKMDLLKNGIYFDPHSNLAVPLKVKWSDSKSKVSRFASLPCNCDRDTYECYCCVKFGLQIFNFDRTGCMNVTYDPNQFSFDWRMTWQNESLYNYTINAKNPPPACINTPIPYLPSIDFCVLFYNIFTPGRNIHMCVNFLTRIEHAEVFVMEFDCFKIGVDGFQTFKPEENAGITTEDPDESEMTTTDYDEIGSECIPTDNEQDITYNNTDVSNEDAYSNDTESTTTVLCEMRPTRPTTIAYQENDMSPPTPTSGNWCFYFWCDANTTTTTVTPPTLNEQSTSTPSGVSNTDVTQAGSAANPTSCWTYFWCSDIAPSTPSSSSPSTNLSSPANNPSETPPQTTSPPSSSNWCFYFWCDSTNSTMNPLPLVEQPSSSGSYPSMILAEEEKPNGQTDPTTEFSVTTQILVTTEFPLYPESSDPTTDSSFPPLPNTEYFNSTLEETYSNSSSTNYNQTTVTNSSQFVNVSSFSNSTVSNFTVSSQISNSTVVLYFPSGSSSSSTSVSSSNTSSSSFASSASSSSSSSFSSFTPLTTSRPFSNHLSSNSNTLSQNHRIFFQFPAGSFSSKDTHPSWPKPVDPFQKPSTFPLLQLLPSTSNKNNFSPNPILFQDPISSSSFSKTDFYKRPSFQDSQSLHSTLTHSSVSNPNSYQSNLQQTSFYPSYHKTHSSQIFPSSYQVNYQQTSFNPSIHKTPLILGQQDTSLGQNYQTPHHYNYHSLPTIAPQFSVTPYYPENYD